MSTPTLERPDAHTRKTARHGTRSGYLAHRRRDEEACAACKAANAEYLLAYRIKTGAIKGTIVSYDILATLLDYAPMSVVEKLAADIGPEAVNVLLALEGVPV